MDNRVHVTVSGLTGSGKTAVYLEIMLALKAIGLTVEHADPEAVKYELATGQTDTDYQLDLYKPTIIMAEVNEVREPPDQSDTAQGGE